MKTRFSSTEPPAPAGYVNGVFAETLENGIRKVAVHVPTGGFSESSPVEDVDVVNFTDLADVPPSYVGQGGKLAAVKEDETGIEFITASEISPPPTGGSSNEDILAAVFGRTIVPPVDADFAWINQGGASVDTSGDGIVLYAPAGSGNNFRIRKKAITPPFDIITLITPQFVSQNNCWTGMVLRQSDGKFQFYGINFTDNGEHLWIQNWTNPTTWAGSNPRLRDYYLSGTLWLRITDDNVATRNYYFSTNGRKWSPFFSEGRTAHITASEAGICVNVDNADIDAALWLRSWEQ